PQVSGTRLRLSQVGAADSGEYVCRVTLGTVTQEASVIVTVPSSAGTYYSLQSPIISIDPHSMAVAPGEDATFKCRIHDGAQPINITWRMGPGQHLQDNVKVSSNGSVISITRAHVGNQGAYHCVASNRFGVASSVVNLLVQGAPTVSVMPPGPVTVKEGKSLSVECLGRGEPRPLVRWSRPGSRHKVEHQTLLHMDSQAVLQFSPAKLEHTGSYVCTAHSALGSAQARLEVTVEPAQRHPGAPEVTAPSTVTVVAGDTAPLPCHLSISPHIHLSISAHSPPSTPPHGSIHLGAIPTQAQPNLPHALLPMLSLPSPPYATTLPEEATVHAGEGLQVQCVAHGTPPLDYAWEKVNGSLSARAVHRGGLLRLSPALPADAGVYVCRASAPSGQAEDRATLTIQGRNGTLPSISPQTPEHPGTSPPSLPMPTGTLIPLISPHAHEHPNIPNLSLPPTVPPPSPSALKHPVSPFPSGTPAHDASSVPGGHPKTLLSSLPALPRALINIRTAVQTVLAGTTVELECLGLGDPRPHVTWSKVGGQIRPGVLVHEGTLTMEQVERADAGQYRCTATNPLGTVQSHVILHVQATPQIAGQPEVKEVSLGSAAVLPCLASGFPVPEISWSKLEGELPAGARVEGNVLTLPAVRHEDAGVYACAAANRRGQQRLVPYFGQTPRSFLPLPTIKDAYKRFEILITFRPDAADGCGHRAGITLGTWPWGGDGPREVGVGLGPHWGDGHRVGTTLRIQHWGWDHPGGRGMELAPLNMALGWGWPQGGGRGAGTSLGRWAQGGHHPQDTALGLGSPWGQGHGVGTTQGTWSWVGNHPREMGTWLETTLGTGAQGWHHPQDMGTGLASPWGDKHNVDMGLGEMGIMDVVKLSHWVPPQGSGHSEVVSVPSFTEDGAFVSYPPLTNVHHELRLEAEFLPLAPDGLLLFSAGKAAPVEDFVALAMVGGHLEFRYELGSATLLSPNRARQAWRRREPVALGRWHRVTAERVHKDGSLALDEAAPVKRSSPGKSQGLNLRSPLYLGGTEPPLRPPTNATFQGCIGEVSVNGKKLDLSYSFLRSRGVRQGGQSSP
ncbi:Basement membrane-specific heparan sulfate proteoglycan core protein, partial [Dryobates pubescens]